MIIKKPRKYSPKPADRYTQCAAKGCQKMPARGARSRFCAAHALRLYRYGHEEGNPVRERELEPYRQKITAGLVRYAQHPAVLAATTLAAEVLDYQPRYGWKMERDTRAHMQRLTSYGVAPLDLVRRVCEAVAYMNAVPGKRARGLKEEDHILARAVLALAPQGTARSTGHQLGYLGGLLRESLMHFAGSFLRKLEADEAAMQALKRTAVDWSDTAGATP